MEKLNNYYVVTDFDRTLTEDDSLATWAVVSRLPKMNENYVEERNKLYKKYRPIELDETMDYEKRSKLIEEWFYKHLSLFVKYKIPEESFNESHKFLKPRKGVKQLLYYLHENNIPVIIISAGITNIIEAFLKANNMYYDNIYVISNTIMFKDHISAGITGKIIHSLNKNVASLPKEVKEKIKALNNVVVMGDQIADLKAVELSSYNKVLKIGVLTSKNDDQLELYKNTFDIVMRSNDSFELLIGEVL